MAITLDLHPDPSHPARANILLQVNMTQEDHLSHTHHQVSGLGSNTVLILPHRRTTTLILSKGLTHIHILVRIWVILPNRFSPMLTVFLLPIRLTLMVPTTNPSKHLHKPHDREQPLPASTAVNARSDVLVMRILRMGAAKIAYASTNNASSTLSRPRRRLFRLLPFTVQMLVDLWAPKMAARARMASIEMVTLPCSTGLTDSRWALLLDLRLPKDTTMDQLRLSKAILLQATNIPLLHSSIRHHSKAILHLDKMDRSMSSRAKLIKMTVSVSSVPLPMMHHTTRILILLSLHIPMQGLVIA
jgi:hypothetical protein